MTTLVAGLVAFLLVHSLRIFAGDWRVRQIARTGPGVFRLAYSVVSLGALALIVWGYGMARADPLVLWESSAKSRHVTAALTIVGFILIAAAYVPGTRIRAIVGHPMTAGIALWALGHLFGSGRLAGVVLFGSFLAWALVIFAVRWREDRAAGAVRPPGRASRDAIAAVIGFAAALVFALALHGPLIGVTPFG